MKFLSDILAKAGLTVDGVVTLNNTATGQTPNANDNSTKLATTAWVRTFVQPYSLPIATSSVLGGIKVGTGLSIDAGTGVLSVSGGGSASIKSTQTFTATAAQTVFTISGGYSVGLIDVFLNGVYLSPNQTTATNGTTITLGDAAAAGDIIDVIIASPVYQGATTTTDQLPEGSTNLYFTNARARAAITLTTTGVSGVATYNNTTGVFNIPNYQGLVPSGGTTGQILTKNSGTDYDSAWIENYADWTAVLKHRVKAGEAVTKGQAVYVSSADGTNMIVSKASNATEGTSSKTMGLLESTVSTNGFANVITEGLLSGLNTATATAGDPVWLGTDGNLIYGLVNKPSAPAHLVFIGVVTRRNANNGEIFVKVQNGFEMKELHDYVENGVQNNFVISYESSTSLYKPKSIATLLGYTPANAARSLTINGTSYDLTADRTWTLTTSNITEGTNLYYTDTRVGTYLTANSYATQSYVSTQINNLVSGAPGLLDTLDELAAALGDDPNFATTVSTALSNRLRIDINNQGLTSTQQGNGRTNLGLGSLAVLSSVANAQITDLAYSKLTGVPSTFTPSSHTHPISDITGLQTALDSKQASLSGTGFVKISGSTISYDNNTYLTTSSASSTYQTIISNPITGSGAGNSGEIVYFTGSTSVGGTAAFAWSSPTMTIGLSAASNQTDYKVLIQRHGTLANPGTWTDSNGLQVVDYAADGPSVGFIATGLVSIELPRISTTDTYAGNAVALRVATDNMTVLAVKGNGTVHLGQNGSVDSGERLQVSGTAKFSSTVTTTKLLLNDGDPKITFTPSAYSGSYRSFLGTRSSAEGVLQLGNNGANYIVGGNTGANGALLFYVNATSDFIAGTNGTLALTLAANAAATFAGNITAANFSGSSSGTNTGDQTLSGLGGAPNAGSFGDANAITTGGFFAAFNPSNIPAGQSSGDWGVLSQPLWTSNSSGERYTLQFAANLDSNANIFVRKFRYNGSVLQSAWYTLLNSSNYSAYTGSGTSGRLSKWAANGVSLNDSVITDNGTNIRVGNPLLADSRFGVGTAGGDQTYASIFIGGAITNGINQYAVLCDPQLAGSSDNYALFANARIKANTAVTNTFGVYIPSAEKLSGATIVNNYALYIANQTSGSSTNYSIYSSGGRNYFGDKVSIGSNTFFTVAQFLVNGGLVSSSSAIAQFNGFIRMKDQLIIHNDANTGLESYLQCTGASEITTLNLKASNIYASGNLVTIGSWDSATTLQFQSANNSIGRINFYDQNATEGVYVRNIGTAYGGDLRFGARWDDDEDKIFFTLRQSSAGAAFDARFGINVDPTETFHVASNGITAGATSKGWPVYDAELDTQARRFIFQTAGNNAVATAGQGATVALVLGQYYDSRVVITPQSNGGASPGDQGTGHGKDMMIKGGTSDNGVGYKGGRLYLNGGMGYTSGGYNGNFGTVRIQTYGGVVNIGEITGETRRLNVAYSIGIRANLTGTEQEIIRMGNTGSGVNDGYLALLDSNNTKVLLGANASRSGDNFINNGGNFGINTDVPTNKLEVFSGSTTADALTLSFTTGADNRHTGIFFKGGPFPYARIVGGTTNYGPDQGFISFYTNFNPSGAAGTSGWCLERVRINPNGSIVATGDITAFGSPSDARLKDIKEVIPNALTSILKLSGYRFDWKEVNHLTKIKEDMGVIAQEVEKVLPELARTNDDGTMSVRYQGLTAVLIEAIKEQQTQIESQKSEIEELKDLVKQLINR